MVIYQEHKEVRGNEEKNFIVSALGYYGFLNVSDSYCC
jgi:hypothetical protein